MKQKKILVVENEVEIQKIVEFILKSRKYKVVSVSDCWTGISKMLEAEDNKSPFNLVITDIQMPGLSGLDMIAKIRVLNLDIPILVISGLCQKEFQLKLTCWGCVECIEMPFTTQKLLDSVKGLLKNKEMSI